MTGFFERIELDVRPPLPRAPLCGKCKLLHGCISPKMPVYGKGKRGVMVIAEAPGEQEDQQNKPLIGRAGQRFQEELRLVDWEMSRDCWATNALSCRPPNNVIDNDNKIGYCRPLVMQAIETHKPRVIILLGLTAVKSVIGHLWKSEVGAAGRWTGWQIPIPEWNCWLCPTLHPSYLLRLHEDPLANRDFRIHIRRALALKGRPFETLPDYESSLKICMDDDEAATIIKEMNDFEHPIAWDIETTCLKPTSPHAEIVCCSFSNGSTSVSFPWCGKAYDEALILLTSPSVPKIGWNAKFEHEWLKSKEGITVRNWIWDGMIAAHAQDSRSAITGLEFQEFMRLGIADHKGSIKQYLKTEKGGNTKNKIKDLPIRDLLRYNAMDSLVEYLIGTQQMKEMNL